MGEFRDLNNDTRKSVQSVGADYADILEGCDRDSYSSQA